jgi:ATP-dependent DNA helicase RecG
MFTLDFPRPTYLEVQDGTEKPLSESKLTHDTPHDTPHVKRLLSVHQDEITRGELMELLELKDRMYFSKEYLAPALQGGFIEMTIPDKPKSKLQKYRLTEKGRKIA